MSPAKAFGSKHLQSILPFFDLIVGTMPQLGIAGGKEDLIETLRESARGDQGDVSRRARGAWMLGI